MIKPAAQIEAALRARARDGARRFALLCVAVILLLVGAGFLTSAIWIAAAAAWSPLVASLILALFCLVAGAMLYLQVVPPRGRARPVRRPPPVALDETPPPGTKPPYPPLAEAFLFGLDTAMRLRRARDR